ncbi:hypothetical protein Goarm_004155 [Gossypium armourianum]|uniref:Uncharacterized protein n=1 Tax=Gossypium armourianum TaxID=34283 RepID=A0A7J9K5J7_9ROSI|nr:hypothetical protein [Gossypium armourianum]
MEYSSWSYTLRKRMQFSLLILLLDP